MNDKIQKQEAGDGSTNLQGQSIVINQGISYHDAKEIALDVFKANYIELSKEATLTATNRAEKLTNDFLESLKEKHKESIDSLSEPAMQMALFDAQKAYVATGDEGLEALLVDILVERATEDKRTIKQITLDESLKVAPKLTTEQFDALTVNFILSKTIIHAVVNVKTFTEYLNKYILPFTKSITSDSSCFEHLEYTGCGSIMEASTFHPIEQLMKNNYQALFQKGFTKEEFENQVGVIENFSEVIMNHFALPDKLQIRAINQNVLENLCTTHKIKDEDKTKLKIIFDNFSMNNQEIKDKIIEISPEMEKLFELWSSTSINKFKLTTVGIAIAQANLRSKQGIVLDLSIWVK